MMNDDMEIWVVEVPDKIIKSFGQDKNLALDFQKQLGKNAVMWDMMEIPNKGNNGKKKQKV